MFVQNAAALALARLLKERHPQLITVFGGANFDGEMGLEYVRALPWIDYAVLGEADETFGDERGAAVMQTQRNGSHLAAWLILGLYGLFTACTDGVGKAWISGLVPAGLQSSAQGIFQGATGFAVLSAGLWAGLLWGARGQLPLLISGIAGGFFAAILLILSIGAWIRTKSSTTSAN